MEIETRKHHMSSATHAYAHSMGEEKWPVCRRDLEGFSLPNLN